MLGIEYIAAHMELLCICMLVLHQFNSYIVLSIQTTLVWRLISMMK
jgi:hypothetical protein